jgi:hypothetical protein
MKKIIFLAATKCQSQMRMKQVPSEMVPTEKLGGLREEPTARELEFIEQLEKHTSPPYFDLWLHTSSENKPWLLVSMSYINEGVVNKTLRLDFDGNCITGGWSLHNLNGDDGVPAALAGVSIDPPDGIFATNLPPADLGIIAAEWFRCHYLSL